MPQFNTPDLSPFVTTVDGLKLYFKTYNIGAWNMLTDYSINIAHSLGITPIVFAYQAMLDMDVLLPSGRYTYPLNSININTGLTNGGLQIYTSIYFVLHRSEVGVFKGVDFSNAVLNRGILNVIFAIP